MQPGDVKRTFADIDQLVDVIGFKPDTDIYTGMRRFVEWYTAYNK